MPKVLFLDTKPHIYTVLKRKFEREGFEVIAEGQDQEADLIVMGKSEPDTLVNAPTISSSVPVILLSSEDFPEIQESQTAVAHLKMPFRPSQLMAMARQAVMGIV